MAQGGGAPRWRRREPRTVSRSRPALAAALLQRDCASRIGIQGLPRTIMVGDHLFCVLWRELSPDRLRPSRPDYARLQRTHDGSNWGGIRRLMTGVSSAERGVHPTLVRRWPTVVDGWPTSHQRCFNISHHLKAHPNESLCVRKAKTWQEVQDVPV